MSHTTVWEGAAYPEQRGAQPKTPGPLKGGKLPYGKRPVTVTMHHDGDPKGGNIKFWLPNWLADAAHHPGAGPDEIGMVSVSIPFDAMLELVLNYYRDKMINALEQAEGEQLEQLVFDTIVEDVNQLDANREQEKAPSSPQLPGLPVKPTAWQPSLSDQALIEERERYGLGPETL